MVLSWSTSSTRGCSTSSSGRRVAMSELHELIQAIRARPELVLAPPSVNSLYNFLAGFCYARRDDANGDHDFLVGFGHYVHERYKIMSSQSWAQIIEFFSTCE